MSRRASPHGAEGPRRSATPATPRLSRREFARALRLGLGRARLDVRRHGIEGRLDLLLAACLRDATMDRQMEGSLAGWLTDIARDRGCLDEVSRAVTQASQRGLRRGLDRDHVARVLAQLSLGGDRRARAALLRMLDTGPADDVDVARTVVWALGEAGWRHVVRALGRRWARTGRADLGWLVWTARNAVGARRAAELLPRGGPAHVREFAARVRQEFRAQRSRVRLARDPDERPAPTLGDLEDGVRRGEWSVRLMSWARRASPTDRRAAWRRVRSERAPRRLARRLLALAEDPSQRYRPDVVRLTAHSNRSVRSAAWTVLSRVTDPRVRAAALRALRKDPDRAVEDGALDVFERNARDEDAAVLDAAFPRRATPERLHEWIRGVDGAADPVRGRDGLRRGAVALPRRGPAWDALLLRAYEESPCRSCREFVLSHLVDRRAAPRSVLREALWDANGDVRRVARAGLRRSRSSPSRTVGRDRGA